MTRSRKARLAVATRLLEAYQRRQYRTTSAGRRVDWDEPDRDDDPEVIAHNKAVASKLAREKKKKEGIAQLKKQGAVPIKQGKPMYEDKRVNKQSQIGKVYYAICPDDSRYYKTIFIRHNPFTNALQPMISNEIMGTPPPGMDPISPLMLSRLTRVANNPMFE